MIWESLARWEGRMQVRGYRPLSPRFFETIPMREKRMLQDNNACVASPGMRPASRQHDRKRGRDSSMSSTIWTLASRMRIALLDDHAVVRYGLAARLAEEPDLEVVGSFATSKELMTALRASPADLLLIDYSLGSNDIDGLNLIRALRVRFPRSKILVTSAHNNPATVALAMKAGARGFVGKSQELGELVQAIRTVSVGREYLNAAMARELTAMLASDSPTPAPEGGPPQVRPPRRKRNSPPSSDSLSEMPSLSPREREVLRCCLDGLSVTAIADKFARSVKTISGQKQSAFRKLGVRSDNELFKIEYQIKDL